MKHALIFGLLLACLQSCMVKDESPTTKVEGFKVVVVDSCEYIEIDEGIFDQRVYSLCHKGNCKFCAQRSAEIKPAKQQRDASNTVSVRGNVGAIIKSDTGVINIKQQF